LHQAQKTASTSDEKKTLSVLYGKKKLLIEDFSTDEQKKTFREVESLDDHAKTIKIV
jgi:hypothetical protein